MGINTTTMKFKDDLITLINQSNLPICIVEMIMSNVLSAVQARLRESIEMEKVAESIEESKEESGVTSDD